MLCNESSKNNSCYRIIRRYFDRDTFSYTAFVANVFFLFVIVMHVKISYVLLFICNCQVAMISTS